MRIIKSHSVVPRCLEWPHQFTTSVKYRSGKENKKEKKKRIVGKTGRSRMSKISALLRHVCVSEFMSEKLS